MIGQILSILLVAFTVSLGIVMFDASGLWNAPQFLVSMSVPVCGLSLVGLILLGKA